MAKPSTPQDPLANLDHAPYAGRWIAIVRGRITGVGLNEQQARLASKHQRPKEEPRLIFVADEHGKSE